MRKPESFDLGKRIRFCIWVANSLLAVSFIIFLVVAVSAYHDFAVVIDQQIAGGFLKSRAGLYAAPRVIEKGSRFNKEQLATILQRGGYARNQASSIWNGSFEVNEAEIRILPRQGAGSHEWVSIKFDERGYVAELSANDQANLLSYSLEPELLTPDASVKIGKQQNLTYQEIPTVMVQAITAIEDKRFFEHHGLDLRGIVRATLRNISGGTVHFQQGGSTITQQLVKNVYLTPEKTLRRKFDEAILAVALENRLSKQDIFALYCNEVYLGQRTGVGVRGVAQAAKVFFGKELHELSLQEAATIAGMIQSPARYAPDKHPDAAQARRDVVISAMARDGVIDSQQAQTAKAVPVAVAPFQNADNDTSAYYVDAVNRSLEDSPSAIDVDDDQPVRVQTTIDPDLQAAAEKALIHQLDSLSKKSGNARPQGALVALDPYTGHVLAMVGGRNYAESQLNRATDARRQPGSVFKPFVYAAAFEAGISPLSTFSDTPQTFQYGNASYSPDNHGQAYSMHEVMMREGLIRSLNVVTVELAMRVGLSSVANTAHRFGLPRPEPYPALALGTTEVTPLEVAAAYAAFVNGGKLVKPKFVAGDVDNNVDATYDVSANSEQVVNPTTAYMITDMLSEVTTRGTAGRAKASFKKVAIAGKTGTSRDGWFVGYTSNLVCAVWIGYDDNKQLGLTGAEAALPAWIDFVKEAVAIRPSLGGESFSKPAGIMTLRIDPETGFLAGPECPASVVVSIASRYVRAMDCYKHQPLEPLFTDESLSEVTYEEPTLNTSDGQQNSEPEKVAEGGLLSEPAADPEEKPGSSELPSRPQRTERELDRQNRPVLVNVPAIRRKP